MPIRVAIIDFEGFFSETLAQRYAKSSKYDFRIFSPREPEVFKGLCVEKVDILNVSAFKKKIYAFEPHAVINNAEISDPLQCEKKKKLAWRVNAGFVENLCSVCRVAEARLIHISSDLIFNGKRGPYDESAKPDPVNYYGRSKHAAENAVRSLVDNHAVVRLSRVYGTLDYYKKDFVIETIDQLKAGEKVRASATNFDSPVFAGDAAECVEILTRKKAEGIFGVGGDDFDSEFNFAKKIARVYDLDESLVVPVSGPVENVFMPEKAGLVSLKVETNLGLKPSNFETGLAAMKFKIKKDSGYLFKM